MASNPTRRSFQSFIRQARPVCECAKPRTSSIRQFSISRSKRDADYEVEGEQRPRWSYTPEKMKAPYRWRIEDTEKKWECNSDPVRLDRFYVKMLGRGGDKVLTEEVKWLAITHKSFDQGRRGFNDRLAFFGMFCPGYLEGFADWTRSTDLKSADKHCSSTITSREPNPVAGRSFR